MVIVTSTFPASPEDGTPSFVLDLAEGLARRFDVVVVAPRTKSASESWPRLRVNRFAYFWRRYERLADGAIMPNLRERPWLWLQVPTFLLGMTLALARAALANRNGVIHAHWIIPGGLAARLVSLLFRRPYLLTVHGADAYTLNGRLFRILKGWVLSGATVAVPVSRDIRRRLAMITNVEGEKLAEPVPMGLRPQDVPSDLPSRIPNVFLFVGRVAEKKGLTVALHAVSQVEDVQLRVIGDGPGLGEARRLARDLNLEERVQFLGRRGRPEVLREMARSFGLLLPSVVGSDGDSEGTPVVLAESFATGTPLIASSVPGIGENVADGVNGLLAVPGDAGSLADRIRIAVNDPVKFHQMGETARSMFEGSQFDMHVTIDRYAELIGAMVGKGWSRG